MNTIVPENYSLLNCHIHANKSNILKGCDLFSAPIRSVLGGRDIYLKNTKGERHEKSSILMRVMIVFAAATIFYVYSPLLLIPIAAFSLKYVVSLFDKTEIKLKALIKSVISIASNKSSNARDYETAVNDLLELGGAFLRPEDEFLEAVALYSIKANRRHGLESIIRWIENPSKIPGLVDSAIDYRLKEDETTCSYTLSRTDLTGFVKESCINREIKHVVKTYIKLLESALLLKPNNHLGIFYNVYLKAAVFTELEKIEQDIPSMDMAEEQKNQIMSLITNALPRESAPKLSDSYKIEAIFTNRVKLNAFCEIIDEFIEYNQDQTVVTEKLFNLYK